MAGTVARAFALAPECMTIDELKAKLRREGFEGIEAHLQGGSIRNELRRLFKAAN